MSSENSTIAIISAFIAGGALIASIVSARSSARSAAASETSARTALKNLQRIALRDLVIAVNRSVAEADRIRALIPELRSEHRSLANMSGNFGGSREKLADDSLASRLAEADALGQVAAALADQVHSLRDASIEDLTAKLNDVDAAHSKLTVMREGVEREREQVVTMLRSYQDKAIKGRP